MINWDKAIKYAKEGTPAPDKRVEKKLVEWEKILTPEQFQITRNKGTEAPGSGEFCSRFEPGIYGCICCNTPLFDSSIKFDSGTGWPSFNQPVKENVIKYAEDNSFGRYRIEVLCNTCDGHLGHVFPDGPPPSNLRYCINSVAINLVKVSENA